MLEFVFDPEPLERALADPLTDVKKKEDVNVLALVKGDERYIFLFTDAYKAEILRVLGRYAESPDLSFTWYEAAVLSQKVRQESQYVTDARRVIKDILKNRN